MWVARDKSGELRLYKGKPVRGQLDKNVWVSFGSTWENFEIDETFFPYLKWEDEPIEVHLFTKEFVQSFGDTCYDRGKIDANRFEYGQFMEGNLLLKEYEKEYKI